MNYMEPRDKSATYKKNYAAGITDVIKKRWKEVNSLRCDYRKNIFQTPERYRSDLKEILGWPLVGNAETTVPSCKMQKLSEEDGYSIFRLEFEILDGLWMSGILFQAGEVKKPLVLVQHGGYGTPEEVGGFYGSTGIYNDMLHRVRKHDVHVFAPQLLLWHEEFYGIPHERRELDAQLKQLGGSLTALELYGLQRVLDYFETKEYVSCFGMVGMSYGGFYTLYLSALDERILSALSCSFFNSRNGKGWSDWNWFGAGGKFDDAEIACLVYPRKLYLAMGNRDELFQIQNTSASYEVVKCLAGELGTDWISLNIFDGIHEFQPDDFQIDRLISDLTTDKEK